MAYLSFPYLSDKLITLREITIDNAKTIVNLSYQIAEYLNFDK
jgi:hypothetical protein